MNQQQFAKQVQEKINGPVPEEVVLSVVRATALILSESSDKVTEFLVWSKSVNREHQEYLKKGAAPEEKPAKKTKKAAK